jgi:hypothetical protein
LPQYHIKQDDFFETATGKPTDFDTLEPIWKRLAGLDQDPTIGKGKTKGKSSNQPGKPLCRREFQAPQYKCSIQMMR